MTKHPYKYWDLYQLNKHLVKQALEFDIDVKYVKEAVFSKEWIPQIDFDGCTIVQDDLHPFLPCFLHDYECYIYGNRMQNHINFRNNLIKAGFSKFKAQKYFIGVVAGCFAMYLFKKSK